MGPVARAAGHRHGTQGQPAHQVGRQDKYSMEDTYSRSGTRVARGVQHARGPTRRRGSNGGEGERAGQATAKKQELRRVKYLVDKLFQSHFKQKLNRAKIEGTFSEDDLSEIELQVLRTEVLRQDSQLYALNKSALDLGLVIDLYTKKRVDINILLNKVRTEKKKEKFENVIFVCIVATVVVVTGLIVSL